MGRIWEGSGKDLERISRGLGKDLKRIWGGSVVDLRFGKMWGRSGEDLRKIWTGSGEDLARIREGSGEDLRDSEEDLKRIRGRPVTGKPPQIYIYNSRSTAPGGCYVTYTCAGKPESIKANARELNRCAKAYLPRQLRAIALPNARVGNHVRSRNLLVGESQNQCYRKQRQSRRWLLSSFRHIPIASEQSLLR